MAKYEVLVRAKDEYQYMAFLMHQLRYYTKEYDKYLNDKDKEEMESYQKLMDDWLKDNMIKC